MRFFFGTAPEEPCYASVTRMMSRFTSKLDARSPTS